MLPSPELEQAEVWTKPARLTRKNLALFDKMARKKMKLSDPTDDSKSTGTTSTTTSRFAIQARKNGILDHRSSKPPQNLEHLRKRLARSRETPSPTKSAYDDYVGQVKRAKNEATMVVKTSARLLKEYPSGYDQAFKQAFTGLPKDVGFNNGLSAPQPDFVEGLEMEEYLPFPVDERICGAVLYKDDPHSLTLPHVAGEWKGSGKDMEEARMQAAYDGAALVYTRNQALDAVKKPYLAGHAKVTTFTTDGRNLNLFAHYAAETEDSTLEYHQYPIKSLTLVDSHQEYKEGRKQLRNAQDLAREESYALRDGLKDYWRRPRDSLHPIAEGVLPLSVPDLDPLDTTHAYEDEDDYEVVEPQPVYQPKSPISSKHKNSKTPSHHSHNSHHLHSTPHPSKAPSSTHRSTARLELQPVRRGRKRALHDTAEANVPARDGRKDQTASELKKPGRQKCVLEKNTRQQVIDQPPKRQAPSGLRNQPKTRRSARIAALRGDRIMSQAALLNNILH